MTPYPLDPVEATGPMRLVLCAFPSETLARNVSERALRRKLAACANRFPISSSYWWKGRIERANETLVVFKTAPKHVGALFRFLGRAHPYEVPEIVEVDVPRVNDLYLRYLGSTIDPESAPLPLGGGRPPTRRGSPRGPGARHPVRTRAPRRRR